MNNFKTFYFFNLGQQLNISDKSVLVFINVQWYDNLQYQIKGDKTYPVDSQGDFGGI